MTARLSKIVLCLSLALYAGVVAYDNIVDYPTNYAFVQHVLSMDTILATSDLRSRAITSPVVWQIAYAAIIAGEVTTAVLFAIGTIRLWHVRAAPTAAFDAAKAWATAAGTLGILIWFFGFYVVAGEWFASWQAPHWTSEATAFRPLMIILAALIFVNQPDGASHDRPK